MDVGREIRRARETKGWSQAKLAGASDMGVSGISQIETGARNPSVVTLSKIAEALGVEVSDLFPKAARRSSLEPSLLDGLEEERRPSRFAEAITAAAERWAEAVSSADMDDRKRFGLLDAALDLCDLIAERAEGEDWEVIPNHERREIIATMEKLNATSEHGLQHLQANTEAREQEDQIKRRREQMREWTRELDKSA